jgi:hypothetical protein
MEKQPPKFGLTKREMEILTANRERSGRVNRSRPGNAGCHVPILTLGLILNCSNRAEDLRGYRKEQK